MQQEAIELSLPQVRKQLLPLLDREKAHAYTIILDYPTKCLWLQDGKGDKTLLLNREEINAGLWGVASIRIGRTLANGAISVP